MYQSYEQSLKDLSWGQFYRTSPRTDHDLILANFDPSKHFISIKIVLLILNSKGMMFFVLQKTAVKPYCHFDVF